MRKQVPKVIGSDAEFSNHISGRLGDTCSAAVQMLLAALPGVPARCPAWRDFTYTEPETDMQRRYVSNAGCFYNDSEHCEAPTPEVLSATEFIHYWRAALLRLQYAAAAVNRHLPEGERLCVRANNSDGYSKSWASHINILMTREGFDELFRRPLHFLWLSSFLVSSQICAGAGKVGSENGAPACRYQLSQRGGDFFHVLMSWDTMYRRGMINERDEAHAGSDLARLHCIYYDSDLLDFATYLKVGALQLAVAMLEVGYVDPSVLIEDPVTASQVISHSLGRTPVRTFRGHDVTALDLQYKFLDAACKFVQEGLADGIVPEANIILSRWASTLDLLRSGDQEKLARRLDWMAKLHLIESAVAADRCEWNSPQAKMLDHAFSTLDEEEGLFLALERNNLVDRLTDDQTVITCLHQPPESTRAYTRARLMALGETVIEIDWDRMKFLVQDPKNSRRSIRTFDMPEPLFWSKKNTEDVFARATDLHDILDQLEVLRPDSDEPYEKQRHEKDTRWTHKELMTTANFTPIQANQKD